MKQTIGNACGTIGLLHAVYNNLPTLQLTPNSFLADFYTKAQSATPVERAKLLEDDDRVEEVHQETAHDPKAVHQPNMNDTDLHFICFVEKDGFLYELDGRRDTAVNRGASTRETFLKDAIKAVKQIMSLKPGLIEYSCIALAKAAEW